MEDAASCRSVCRKEVREECMNHCRPVRKGLDASTICVWWRSRVDFRRPPAALVETEVHSKL